MAAKQIVIGIRLTGSRGAAMMEGEVSGMPRHGRLHVVWADKCGDGKIRLEGTSFSISPVDPDMETTFGFRDLFWAN